MIYNLFIHIWLILNFLTTTFCLYQLVIALAGLHKDKKYKESQTKRKFAAIIAARNEEAVIGNLVESLKMQDYPKDKFDIIVIADNCTDATAEIAQQAGAIVYKRFNKAEVGKGYVLKFAFEKIFAERDIYDAFCIFDADNVVDRHFISEMNNAIEAGYDVAQGCRDMKNPEDTWISGCHAIFFWMENRFYNSARSILGLSATINGTGFMVTTSFLKQIGYNTYTCTEDIEFSLQSILAGKRIGWVPGAVLYDEQPIALGQSMTQRTRWIKGFIQCFTRYSGSMLRKILKKPDDVAVDAFMYLIGFLVMIAGMISCAMSFIFVVLRIFDPVGTLINLLFITIGSLFAFWFAAAFELFLDKRLSKGLVKAIFTFPIFNALWVPIYIVCIFKKKVDWKPIIHMRNISISEIESNQK
jgi:cellulose synthase/poly-beta-1,6-N-acetylglucosamine synthase-like glycosyltransferase